MFVSRFQFLSIDSLRAWPSLLLFAAVLLAGCGGESTSKNAPAKAPKQPTQPTEQVSESRETLIARAIHFSSRSQFNEAIAELRKVLVSNPKDYEVIFHLGNLEAARGQLPVAIELYDAIPPDHPQAGISSLGMSANWCFQLERFADTEQRYRKILELDSSMNQARRQLAFLFNRQGRRHEANILIRQLAASGDVTQDELQALICETEAMFDSESHRGQRTYAPVDAMGRARLLFTNREFLKAAEEIESIVKSGKAMPSAIALFGRAAMEAQDDAKIALWRKHIDDRVKQFPNHWAAIGTQLTRDGKFQQAVRALAEAVRLDPTDLQSIRRIDQGLRSLGQAESAQLWGERYKLVDRILQTAVEISTSAAPPKTSFETLTKDLEAADRKLEAILWRSIAAGNKTPPPSVRQQAQQFVADKQAFPTPRQAWCGMDLGSDPLPEFMLADPATNNTATNAAKRRPQSPRKSSAVTFRDVSQQIGLDHQYKTAKQPIKKRFAIYQVYGGGIAVCDFDLDGELDLYFAQGAADADNFIAHQSDQLYRTITHGDSRTLREVTDSASVQENQYSVGVTSGDWNQDGFPDLVVTNIGTNQLLINRGDGTFQAQPLDAVVDHQRLCTSVAMGDVTGDQLPDLFVLNFLRDPEIAKLPELDDGGNVVDPILPLSVQPARDQLYVNDQAGQSRVIEVGSADSAACTGLGIVLTDLSDDHAGNEVFVGNDAMANQLWVRGKDDSFVDVAASLGCAYGDHGTATAAMGIAVGDFDRSGTVDLHISNFVTEPSSLYMNAGGIFRDLNVRFRLTQETAPMIGFGSQAIDCTNNGWLDLVVTNGDVEDLQSREQMFRQPIQLFSNLGDRYALTNVDSDYWQRPHLGRALARLDFDRDGKMDFVVTDLLESSKLLLNESAAQNHWISLRLVGTTSERDAIGAKVELTASGQTWTAWVNAGDGYLCKNESVVHFGIGTETNIDQVTVTWPSGELQTFKNVGLDRFALLVEGDAQVFSFAE